MKTTNKMNLPESIYNALKSDDYDYQTNSISVTSLIDSPYIAKLKKEHTGELEEDASDRIWLLLGSAIHYMLEKADTENSIIEQRLSTEIDGQKITGKADYYNTKTLEIQDFKITSVWTVVYKDRYKDFEKQLNCYAYLMRKNGHKVKNLKIVAILRDWVQSKAFNDNYPNKQIQVIDIPLWNIEKQEAFIKERIEAFKNPTECTPEQRWASSDTWAVKKKTHKKAMKVCSSESEAKEYLESKGGDFVEHRPGQDRRCQAYCSVNSFCPYMYKTYRK